MYQKKKLTAQCDTEIVSVESRVGGGAMPEQGLASRAVALHPRTMKLNDLEKKLRAASVPVIGRIENERMLFDMRTVADDEVAMLAESICAVFEVS